MRRLSLAALLVIVSSAPALAHASGRGFVMLLPTGYVIAGGALAVLVSFLVLSAMPAVHARQMPAPAPASPTRALEVVSLASAALLGLVIAAGLSGPHDPAENILPLFVWTLWWVVIVLLHPLFGNLWAGLNPFTGLHALIAGRAGKPAPLRYTRALSYWPAFVVFLGFAWFQLVYPAPEDPDRLAAVLTAYLGASMLCVIAFGPEAWLGRADPFAVFLAQLGAAAPFRRGRIGWPGAGLLSLPALPVSGVLFVLLTLSAITFDGFANTFAWLSAIGINPLDYPGRSEVMSANTLGLLAAFAVLSGGFFLAVAAGWAWAGQPVRFPLLCGRLVYSLIPISIAYHFAHYLGDTLVNLQYLAFALNDPLASGANLLGLDHAHVTASFQNTASGTFAIYSAQTLAIIFGHVVGVAVAHAITHSIAAQAVVGKRCLLRLELPLAVCMVFYTSFGLWLLGAPSIA